MSCIQTRRNRQTGAEISVIDNRDGGFSQGESNWYTTCDTHAMLCSHDTRAMAVAHAACPAGWCPGCEEVLEGNLWDHVSGALAMARHNLGSDLPEWADKGLVEFAKTVGYEIVMGEFFCMEKPAQIIWRTTGGRGVLLQRECDDEWVVIEGDDFDADVTSVRNVEQALDAILAAWKRLTPVAVAPEAPEAPEAPKAPTAVQGHQLRLF